MAAWGVDLGGASGGGGSFDPAAKFDIGYGIPSDLTGSNGSAITSWGHTLSLVQGGDGVFISGPTPLDAPVVATVNSTKVARFTASTSAPTHIGAALGSAASMPFDVWMVTKFASPVAGHVSGFFSPHPGSTVTARVAAASAFPTDVDMTAGDSFINISATSTPGGWHVWRFNFGGTSGSIEVDGSSVASGLLGGSGTLTGFHLGSGYYGDVSSSYDVSAWGISSTILSSGDATAALAYMTALIP